MPKRLIPILSDDQVQQPADLLVRSPKPYLRERAGVTLKLPRGLLAGARVLLSAAFLFALPLGYTSSALAQGNFVYVNNNIANGPNTVSAYSVGADCSLASVPGSPFPTGGTGSGAGVGLANLAEVCGNNLYVANGQSSTITVFAINPATGALTVVGIRVEQVHIAYRLDAIKTERGRAEDRIRQLEIEVATLRSPSRIEARARQIGLVAAGRDQIRLAKEYVAGGTGLAADTTRAASLRGARPPAQ